MTNVSFVINKVGSTECDSRIGIYFNETTVVTRYLVGQVWKHWDLRATKITFGSWLHCVLHVSEMRIDCASYNFTC